MEKLSEILKDLEQGKISADNAEGQVLRLFNVSGQLPPDEEREFTGLWNRQSIPNGSIIKPLTADEMERLKYLYEKKQRR